MKLHPKISELKRRANPITNSSLSVNDKGLLVEDRTVKGYLSVWGIKDTYGTKFIKGCCSKSIQERGPESNSKQKIAFLWQHDITDPIGQFTMLKEDDYGLYFEANIDEVPSGDRALKQIRSGTINQFSKGFNFVWEKMEYDTSDDSIVCFEIEFLEGSAVTIASIPETYAMRSPEQLATDAEILFDETEEFIKSIPRKQQLQLRQLITRHKTLSRQEPQEAQQSDRIALPLIEPAPAGIDYKFLKDNLKLS